MGRHVIGVTGAGPAAGMMSPPPGEVGPPPASAVVFGVADVAFDHACRLGATGLQPPTEIPGVEANGAFYESLLGWTQGPEADDYRAFQPMVSRSRGGWRCPPRCRPRCPATGWSIFAVDDVDRACTRTGELGGSKLVPAMTVQDMRFAVVEDPLGAVFRRPRDVRLSETA